MHSTQKNIPDDTATYINFLSEISDHVVVLTTNAIHVNDATLFKSNVFILNFTNIGLDFGLWSQFINKYKAVLVDNVFLLTLILANDSCVCLQSLKPIYEKNKLNEFWGITDSFEIGHHLQSYFLVFNSSNSVQQLLSFILSKTFHTITNKNTIIKTGEIALSKFMLSKNIPLTAEYKFYELQRLSPSKFTNPSFFYWKILRNLGCPIIKKKKNL